MHPTQFFCGTSMWVYSKRIANFCDFIHDDRKNSGLLAVVGLFRLPRVIPKLQEHLLMKSALILTGFSYHEPYFASTFQTEITICLTSVLFQEREVKHPDQWNVSVTLLD